MVRVSRSLVTEDIEGARSSPLFKFTRGREKEAIEGSQPRMLAVRSKTMTSLDVSDIDGTSYMSSKFLEASRRHTNPLNPTYPLSAVTLTPPLQRSFVRDVLDHVDIVGSKPRRYYAGEAREERKPSHPLVSRSVSKRLMRKEVSTRMLDVSDITVKKPFSRRHTNPLEPEYTMSLESLADASRRLKQEVGKLKRPETVAAIGYVEGSKPRCRRIYSKKLTDPSLRTSDIEGAVALPLDSFYTLVGGVWHRSNRTRRVNRNPLDVSDIEGTASRPRRLESLRPNAEAEEPAEHLDEIRPSQGVEETSSRKPSREEERPQDTERPESGTRGRVQVEQVTSIVDKINQRRAKSYEGFQMLDEERNGTISYLEFADGVARLNVGVSRESALAIAEMFDGRKDGRIDYPEFAQTLNRDLHSLMLQCKQTRSRSPALSQGRVKSSRSTRDVAVSDLERRREEQRREEDIAQARVLSRWPSSC